MAVVSRRAARVAASYGGLERAFCGRGKEIATYQIIDLSFVDGQAKSRLYCKLDRAVMQDQVSWIRARKHSRVVTGVNGRDSLSTACEADVTTMGHRPGAHR